MAETVKTHFKLKASLLSHAQHMFMLKETGSKCKLVCAISKQAIFFQSTHYICIVGIAQHTKNFANQPMHVPEKIRQRYVCRVQGNRVVSYVNRSCM